METISQTGRETGRLIKAAVAAITAKKRVEGRRGSEVGGRG
jgi:hypothetical protein